MRNIFLAGLLAALVFTGCNKGSVTNKDTDKSSDSNSNSNTPGSDNSLRLSKFVQSVQNLPGDTIYLTYNTDGLLDKTKNSKFTRNYFYSGGKLVRTEGRSMSNGVEIKFDENLVYNGDNLVRRERSGNSPDSAYRMLGYDSLVYEGNHIKDVFQIALRPRMNGNGGWVNEKEVSGHVVVKWKNANVDSVYTYDNPTTRLAWVETYTYDDKPNYVNTGADKVLTQIFDNYYTMSSNNVKTAKLTGYSVSTVTVPTVINRSFTYELNDKKLLLKSGILIAQPQQQPSTVTEYFYK